MAGYSNWRLPEIHELFGIVDVVRHEPAIDPIFKCRSSSYYWPGTSFAYGPDQAWVVHFSYDGVYWDVKDGNYYVRCVRKEV